MIGRETRDKEEYDEARHRRKAQPMHDQLEQVAEPEASQGKQASAQMSVAEKASLVRSPRVFSAQRAEAMLELQQTHGNRYVQRLAEEAKEDILGEDMIRRIEAKRGSGQPLEPRVRSQMEGAFGRGFSDVQIHTNASADGLAKDLGAKAFTTGKDVFFREGAYQPNSEAGKGLLAHELTHVVQQESGAEGSQISIGQTGDAFEQEATGVGQALAKGHEVSVRIISAVPRLQRQKTAAEEKAKAVPAGAETEKAAAEAGLDAVEWRNKADSVIKITGNKYRIAILAAVTDAALPKKHQSAMDVFLSELGPNLGKYILGKIPYVSDAAEVLGAVAAAAAKVKAEAVSDAFTQFKTRFRTAFFDAVDKMTKSTGVFSVRLKDQVINQLKKVPEFNKAKLDAKTIDTMQGKVQEMVNEAIFGDAMASTGWMVTYISDYIKRSWDFYLLARLEAFERYRSAAYSEEAGKKCYHWFWGWDEDCQIETYGHLLAYPDMPPDWKGPKRKLNWGEAQGQFRSWYTVTTGVAPEGLKHAWVPEAVYKAEKEKYKE